MTSLNDCKDSDVPFWTFKGTHEAKITEVYDGDTLNAVILHHNKLTKLRIRMLGYDSPEIRTKNLEMKQKGLEARDYLKSLVLDKIVRLECHDFDKYGRILGDIYISEKHVNKEMALKFGMFGRAVYNEYD